MERRRRGEGEDRGALHGRHYLWLALRFGYRSAGLFRAPGRVLAVRLSCRLLVLCARAAPPPALQYSASARRPATAAACVGGGPPQTRTAPRLPQPAPWLGSLCVKEGWGGGVSTGGRQGKVRRCGSSKSYRQGVPARQFALARTCLARRAQFLKFRGRLCCAERSRGSRGEQRVCDGMMLLRGWNGDRSISIQPESIPIDVLTTYRSQSMYTIQARTRATDQPAARSSSVTPAKQRLQRTRRTSVQEEPTQAKPCPGRTSNSTPRWCVATRQHVVCVYNVVLCL